MNNHSVSVHQSSFLWLFHANVMNFGLLDWQKRWKEGVKGRQTGRWVCRDVIYPIRLGTSITCLVSCFVSIIQLLWISLFHVFAACTLRDLLCVHFFLFLRVFPWAMFCVTTGICVSINAPLEANNISRVLIILSRRCVQR